MAEARASKRRKLDNNAAPLPVSADQPQSPQQRKTRASLGKSSENVTAVNKPTGAPIDASNASPKDRRRSRRSNAANSPAVPPIETDTAALLNQTDDNHANGSVNTDDLQRPDLASSTPSRPAKANLIGDVANSVVGAQVAVEDVQMQDASLIAADSQADSLDPEAPRTSGRKRQKSRRLEEADSITVAGTDTLSASQAKKNTVRTMAAQASQDTPSKVTMKRTPASTRGRKASARQTPSKVIDDTIDELAPDYTYLTGPKTNVTPKKPALDEVGAGRIATIALEDTARSAELATPTAGKPATKPAAGRKRASTASKRTKHSEIPDSEPETEDKSNGNGRKNKSTTAATMNPDVQPPSQSETQQLPELVAPPAPTNAQRSVAETPKKRRGTISQKTVQNGSADSAELPSTQETGATNAQSDNQAQADLSNGVGVDTTVAATEISMDGIPHFSSEELLYIQGTVLQRLTRRSTHFLVGMGAETKKVANLIEQTVTAGESNSMVLIGARGSGKSAIVDSIIAQQRLEHGDDFHIVRLSGFIHTDDRIAIREIWRQLGREMEIEEDNQVKNYADTMTTLLALLSHPSETGQAEDGRMAKSVVIILDEFDLFTTHPRQTLLYNLFDIAQSRKAPIAVLGLTTRFDVAESLEKRVKSRFSHRQVYVPLAKNFAAYKEMCKSCLVISGKDLNVPESTLSDRWSKFIAALFDSSTTLNTHLQSLYHTTKSVPAFQTSFLIPLSTLRTDGPLDPEDVQTHIETSISLAPSLAPPDSNLTLLPSLSTLELALLICAARLLIIHDTESASFPLAYDEYKSLASKARIAASAAGALATGSGARVWGVGVARLAWEGLVEKGLVLPVNDRARGGGGVCRVDVSLEELGSVVEATVDAAGMGKWCREI